MYVAELYLDVFSIVVLFKDFLPAKEMEVRRRMLQLELESF